MKKIISSVLIALTLIITISLTYFFIKNKPASEIDKYNIENSVLVQYKSFEKLKNTVSSNDEEAYFIYFGKPECRYCQRYLPLVNEIMYETNTPLLYFNAESIKGTYYNEEGVLQLNKEYKEVIDWIKENSIVDARENNWIGEYTVTDSNNTSQKSEWLMVPRFFKVENGKITNCFKSTPEAEDAYKKYESAKNDTEREYFYQNFKKTVRNQLALFIKEQAKTE